MDTKTIENTNEKLPLGISGLGGWLILVQIGLYGTILMLIAQIFLYIIPSFKPETWSLITSPESVYYHSLLGPLIVFEAVANSLMLIFCIFILFNFYKKKSKLPLLMIFFYSSSLLILTIDMIAIYQITQFEDDESQIRDFVRMLITCLIWIPYFIKSKRVKNTFVR
ncbi:DUF2569 domain-containing protein [Chengkuizengella sp. SCS-71B]|uniref:DUF2569 domain-containing protein n=1 Tax=Chengkuizengella sp. SCS-71B TaxID=3115290 RepID=UPI0032C221EC